MPLMLWEFCTWLAVALLHCPAMFFWANCPCCGCTVECDACTGENGPCEYDVTFAGFSDDLCTECDLLNDTFTLIWTGGATSCEWTYSFGNPPDNPCYGAPSTNSACYFGQIVLELYDEATDYFRVHLGDYSGPFVRYGWRTGITHPYDCQGVSTMNVPLYTVQASPPCAFPNTICGASGMTCTVSAA